MPAASTPPCSSVNVTLSVAINSTDTFYAIDEKPPSGWAISGAGTGSIRNGHIKWLALPGAASNASYQYTAGVLCNASGIGEFSGVYGFDDAASHEIAGQASVAILLPSNGAPSAASSQRGDTGSSILPRVAGGRALPSPAPAQPAQSPSPAEMQAGQASETPVHSSPEPPSLPAQAQPIPAREAQVWPEGGALAGAIVDNDGSLSFGALGIIAALSLAALAWSLFAILGKVCAQPPGSQDEKKD